MNTSVVAYTTICEEDAVWIPQYLTEIKRLGIPYGIHFDRCSEDTKKRMTSSSLCVAVTSQDLPGVEYTEQHKQWIFDKAASLSLAPWMLNWDMDEMWEENAEEKLNSLYSRREDYLRTLWVNCWGDRNHIRSDLHFRPSPRVKLYRISDGKRWRFDHPITNGCKLVNSLGRCPRGYGVLGETDLVCLHTGLMTRSLRKLHKSRWDRIYSAAVGNNPYETWNLMVDEVNYPASVVENTYRRDLSPLPEGIS